eukprot:7299658-Pyramimonas_sp.AAC.1
MLIQGQASEDKVWSRKGPPTKAVREEAAAAQRSKRVDTESAEVLAAEGSPKLEESTKRDRKADYVWST